MDKNTLLSVHNLLDSLMYMYGKYWQCAVHKMKQKHTVSHNNNTIVIYNIHTLFKINSKFVNRDRYYTSVT